MSLYAQHLSTKGAEFIAQFEGYRPNWYQDPVGVHTIGYGHTGSLPPGFRAPLTRAQAIKLLQHDAEKVAATVRIVNPRIMRQSRFDALVSFGYNLGPAELTSKTSSIGDALRKRRGRPKAVAAALLLYDHAGGEVLPGLKRRREAERKLWLTGRYS